MRNQHPLVKAVADSARRKGAAVYAGNSFVVAKWENGDSVELRVDPKEKRPMGKNRCAEDLR